MEDQRWTKKQVMRELAALRRRITELELSEADRERAEESLRLSIWQWRAAFDAMGDAMALLDLEGRVHGCNAAMIELLGQPLERILGADCWELLRLDASERIRDRPFDRVLISRQRETGLFRVGGCWYAVTVEPMVDETGYLIGVVHIMSDVTERRRLEEQVRSAGKVEAIAQLAGGVAQEFNNLLTAIVGFADLMQLELPDTDPMQDYVQRIQTAGERATDVTRRLLAFGRKQIMRPRVVILNAVILGMEVVLRRSLGQDVDLNLALEHDLWPTKVDPTRMGQVIMNLAANARDAMSDGGKLTVETANVELDDDFLARHPEMQVGDRVLLSIADTGPGMSEEVRSHLFEPFYTTKEVGDGSGLGLSVVYGIVLQSGGNIYCRSEEGEGTIFEIYLPRVDEPVEPVPWGGGLASTRV